MRVSVVVFPGSNCDHDVLHMYGKVLGQEVQSVWHRDVDLKNPDLVVLPGGFAYGDYLRTGALAKVSPVMQEVAKFAAKGGPVLGICNGFQILCEVGLLPGALLPNIGRKFLSQFVHMKAEQVDTPFSSALRPGQIITCPIAHFEGNFFTDKQNIDRIEGDGRVVFRYCDPDGLVEESSLRWNPNGSARAIAGICSEKRNVVGLMPHPERAAEKIVGFAGGESGRAMFEAVLR